MTAPAASVAVIRAALEDAGRTGHTDPDNGAQHVVNALEADGWDIVPTRPTNPPQRPA
jgi:hypothetical protein